MHGLTYARRGKFPPLLSGLLLGISEKCRVTGSHEIGRKSRHGDETIVIFGIEERHLKWTIFRRLKFQIIFNSLEFEFIINILYKKF